MKKAFTLIEVLTVLAILSLLVALAFAVTGNVHKNGRVKHEAAVVWQNMQAIQNAFDVWRVKYPSGNISTGVDIKNHEIYASMDSYPQVGDESFWTNVHVASPQYVINIGDWDGSGGANDYYLNYLTWNNEDVCNQLNEMVAPAVGTPPPGSAGFGYTAAGNDYKGGCYDLGGGIYHAFLILELHP